VTAAVGRRGKEVVLAETEFIASVESFLATLALTPAPAIGVAEPADPSALPAVVISLEETGAVHPGVGERTSLITGALRWTVTIDLANPVLADPPPPFDLLDPTRTQLTLPHGGQVRADGTTGPLGAADVSISVGAAALALVAGVPTGNQFAVDPAVGAVTLGTPLPATGTLTAGYFLGQWEQRISRIAGTLRVDVCAAAADDTRGLADQILAALAGARARAAIPRLNALVPSNVSSVGAPDPASGNARRRTLRFTFDFENEINQPDSSGGVIREIPLRGPAPPPQPNDTQFLT
jgi:hypothetical protein